MKTIGEKIRFEARKLLISLARPEGFEPPTLRSEVRQKTDPQKTEWKRARLFKVQESPLPSCFVSFRLVPVANW